MKESYLFGIGTSAKQAFYFFRLEQRVQRSRD